MVVAIITMTDGIRRKKEILEWVENERAISGDRSSARSPSFLEQAGTSTLETHHEDNGCQPQMMTQQPLESERTDVAVTPCPRSSCYQRQS